MAQNRYPITRRHLGYDRRVQSHPIGRTAEPPPEPTPPLLVMATKLPSRSR